MEARAARVDTAAMVAIPLFGVVTIMMAGSALMSMSTPYLTFEIEDPEVVAAVVAAAGEQGVTTDGKLRADWTLGLESNIKPTIDINFAGDEDQALIVGLGEVKEEPATPEDFALIGSKVKNTYETYGYPETVKKDHLSALAAVTYDTANNPQVEICPVTSAEWADVLNKTEAEGTTYTLSCNDGAWQVTMIDAKKNDRRITITPRAERMSGPAVIQGMP